MKVKELKAIFEVVVDEGDIEIAVVKDGETKWCDIEIEDFNTSQLWLKVKGEDLPYES